MTVCCLLLVRKSGEDMLKNNRSFLDFYLSEMPKACPLFVLKTPAFRILNKRLVISLKRRKIGVYEKIAKSLFV